MTEETPEDEIPKTNNQNNDSTSPTPHQTMELTINGFPTLPSTTPKTTQHDSQDTQDIGDFSDYSVEPSPAVTSAKPIQTSFKRPRDTTLDSEDNPNNSTFNCDQRNAVIKICRELHKYNFRDMDRLKNINMDKKRRIISKAMYIQLGDYDPSNEYITNYSDVKTIRLYRKLTENKIDIETLYQQIHNRLSKQDRPKRIKQAN